MTKRSSSHRRRDVFEGRAAEVDRFKAMVNLIRPKSSTDPRVLYFHGPNGIGKSTLMRHLRDAVLPTMYSEARGSSSDTGPWNERHAQQAPNRTDATQVALAYLDFKHDGNSIECPKIGAVGLYAIARQLAKFNVGCPLFTVACFAHFKAWARASDKRDFALLRTEELKALNEAWEASGADSIPGSKFAIAVLDLLRRHANWLFDKATGDELAERAKELGKLNPASELAAMLPALLAEDLNRAVHHDLGPARIVLLFDSHDAFWSRTDSPEAAGHFHLQDRWLRQLLVDLAKGDRITVVVAGRTRPLWHASIDTRIDDADVLLHELGGLHEIEALRILALRGYNESEAKSIVEHAKKVSNLPAGGIHPATLEALALRDALPIQPVDLLEWLVAGINDPETRDALVVLTAFEAFSDADYFVAADTLRFAATRARLRELVRDEWLEISGSGSGPSYRLAGRVHRILKAALKNLPAGYPNLLNVANEALADHFSRKGDRLRAAFHRNQVNSAEATHDAAAYLRGDRE